MAVAVGVGSDALPCSVYAISDVHTDYPENVAALRSLQRRPADAVIVAGDVSHDLAVLRLTLEIFKSKFRHVFFCPGNHDVWLHKGDGCRHSFQKFDKVTELCEELGVHTSPRAVGPAGACVLVVPMTSWYEPAFDVDPEVPRPGALPIEEVMADFNLCRWPPGYCGSDSSLAAHFDGLNEDVERPPDAAAVISFSHFLPRPELLPEKRYLFLPELPKASGSRALGRRVAQLRPDCHIFGHTHFGWDGELDGIRYAQAAMAYPQERVVRGFSLACRGATGSGNPDDGVREPALIYDANTRSCPRWTSVWSAHYARHPRRPCDVRWIWRQPRNKSAVVRLIRAMLDGGEDIQDEQIERLLDSGSVPDELVTAVS